VPLPFWILWQHHQPNTSVYGRSLSLTLYLFFVSSHKVSSVWVAYSHPYSLLPTKMEPEKSARKPNSRHFYVPDIQTAHSHRSSDSHSLYGGLTVHISSSIARSMNNLVEIFSALFVMFGVFCVCEAECSKLSIHPIRSTPNSSPFSHKIYAFSPHFITELEKNRLAQQLKTF